MKYWIQEQKECCLSDVKLSWGEEISDHEIFVKRDCETFKGQWFAKEEISSKEATEKVEYYIINFWNQIHNPKDIIHFPEKLNIPTHKKIAICDLVEIGGTAPIEVIRKNRVAKIFRVANRKSLCGRSHKYRKYIRKKMIAEFEKNGGCQVDRESGGDS